VDVLIPSVQFVTADCRTDGLGREFEGQRRILCGKGLDVTFRLFDESRWSSLERAVRDSTGHVDVLEMPFEACPEDVPGTTRSRLSALFSAMRRSGVKVVAASGNAGSLACRAGDGRRFPSELPQVESIGSGRPNFENYTLRWRGKPDYFVDSGTETIGDAGSSFAAARFVLWITGRGDSRAHVERNTLRRAS
jgi:hypothetical protein